MPNCGRAGPKTPSPPRWKRSWHQTGPATVPLDPLGAAGISASPVFWTQKVLWVLGQLGWVLTCTRGGPQCHHLPPARRTFTISCAICLVLLTSRTILASLTTE